jgi:hypothetical protein
MTTTEQYREQIRARRRKPEAPQWHFPRIGEFYQSLRVLVFDATLTNCGWAGMTAWHDRIDVWAKGTVRPVTQRLSYLGTWDKAAELHHQLALIDRDFGYGAHVVVEAPSVGGGSRTESSLIAGLLVAMLRPAGGWDAVSATHVSAVLLGDHSVRSAERKPRIREAVIRLVPEAAGRDWNEHERDAVATGATWLYDEALRRPQQPYRRETGDE